MNKDKITKLALAAGFKLKQQEDGSMALNSYVFDFAEALLKAGDRISQEPSCYQWRMTNTEIQTDWTDVCKEVYEGMVARYKGPSELGTLEFRTLHVPTRTFLQENISDWKTVKESNTVTMHTRVVEGVLCRWWGDSAPPEGVKLINSLFECFEPWCDSDYPTTENKVDVKLRDGSILRNRNKASVWWRHDDDESPDFDIVGWRLSKDAQ